MSVPGSPAGFDDPSAPRVYEYLAGGSDYFPADRALAEDLMDPEKGYPGLRELVRANRDFILEAARWAGAMLEIGEFLDLGCGLPSVPMIHDAARAAVPAARVAYVDKDPMVVRHLRCVQAEEGWEGTAVTWGDACDPAAVLADEAVRKVAGLSQPACAIFGGTLSAMPAETAQRAVAGYAEALAPGSGVIISCVSSSQLPWKPRRRTW